MIILIDVCIATSTGLILKNEVYEILKVDEVLTPEIVDAIICKYAAKKKSRLIFTIGDLTYYITLRN